MAQVFSDLPAFVDVSGAYMKMSNMSILNIIGHNDSDLYLAPFLQNENIRALFYYSFDSGYSGAIPLCHGLW